MIISYSEIEKSTIGGACQRIAHSTKKKIEDLSILDLVVENNILLPFVHGLYAFFDIDGETCLYVGRVTSPQFIERIPAHFAISEASWSNQFLKAHKEHNGVSTLVEAAIAAKKCQILLIPMPSELVKEAEKLFILFLEPKYNKRVPSRRYFQEVSTDMLVGDGIKKLQA